MGFGFAFDGYNTSVDVERSQNLWLRLSEHSRNALTDWSQTQGIDGAIDNNILSVDKATGINIWDVRVQTRKGPVLVNVAGDPDPQLNRRQLGF